MIVGQLNKLLTSEFEGLEWKEELIEPEIAKCPLHPKYEGKKPPTSKKEGCECQANYEAFKDAKPKKVGVPVFGANEARFGSEVMMEIVRQLYKTPEEYRTPEEERSFLSASKVGQCVYKSCLSKLGAKPEPFSTRSKLTFMFGSILESTYRYLLRTCKFDGFVFHEVPELQNVMIGGEPQRGYYDGVIEVSIAKLQEEVGGSDDFWDGLRKKHGKETLRILFEMKTKTDYGFKDLQRSGKMGYKKTKDGLVYEDHFGYRAQLGVYLRQALADGLIDIPMGVWLVISKNTGAALEVFSSLKQLEEDVEKADANFKIVANVVRNNKPLPERPYGMNEDGSIQNFPCGYCDQKWSCWSDAEVVGFEVEDDTTEQTRYRPVYKEEPTIWLEVQFDRGKPVFVVMEKQPGDDE